MLPTLFMPFLLASLLIELTPGPNMTYLALVSASEGRKAGFAMVAGIALGLATIGLVAAFGVTEIIRSSPAIYEAMRWAGVGFLLYLAWEGWTGGGEEAGTTGHTNGRYFVRGLVTNLLNPKAGIFYVSVLPTFIAPEQPAARQGLVLTLTYVAVATAVHLAVVALAGGLEPMLNDPAREKPVRRALSAMLALVAIWFAWTTAR
jgi:threonine/homoserine/homoserine lactone efflux protein